MTKEKPTLSQNNTSQQMDQLLLVIDRKSWLSLSALAFGLLLLVAWSLFGRIPITHEGQGILMIPGQIKPLYAPGSGILGSLAVMPGSLLKPGDLIAVLDLPQLEKATERERAHLAELERLRDRARPLNESSTRLELAMIKTRRGKLHMQLSERRQLAKVFRTESEAFLAERRKTLRMARDQAAELVRSLEGRVAAEQDLKKRGLGSEVRVTDARAQLVDYQDQLNKVEAELREVDLKEIEVKLTFQNQLQEISALEADLNRLDVSESALQRALLESEGARDSEIAAIRAAISRDEALAKNQGRISSRYHGRILDITVFEGDYVQQGQRLGSIETETSVAVAECLAYFPMASGKKIRPGMKIMINPDPIQRERFGSMVGEVTSVSPFSVTEASVANATGNANIAQRLIAGQRLIEVRVSLPRDPVNGHFIWTSSKGPDLEISSGTTATVRVVVEDLAPIALVIPFLRSLYGA